MAENAASDESRRIHGALAADYAARIADAKCRRAPLSVDWCSRLTCRGADELPEQAVHVGILRCEAQGRAMRRRPL